MSPGRGAPAPVRIGKWLLVDEQPSASGKTSVFRLVPTAGGRPVGFVVWYGKWRRYALQPEPSTVFESDCLFAIAEFCRAKTRAHVETRKAPRS